MKKRTFLQGTRNPFRVEGFCANRAMMPSLIKRKHRPSNIGANRIANRTANQLVAQATNQFAASMLSPS